MFGWCRKIRVSRISRCAFLASFLVSDYRLPALSWRSRNRPIPRCTSEARRISPAPRNLDTRRKPGWRRLVRNGEKASPRPINPNRGALKALGSRKIQVFSFDPRSSNQAVNRAPTICLGIKKELGKGGLLPVRHERKKEMKDKEGKKKNVNSTENGIGMLERRFSEKVRWY